VTNNRVLLLWVEPRPVSSPTVKLLLQIGSISFPHSTPEETDTNSHLRPQVDQVLLSEHTPGWTRPSGQTRRSSMPLPESMLTIKWWQYHWSRWQPGSLRSPTILGSYLPRRRHSPPSHTRYRRILHPRRERWSSFRSSHVRRQVCELLLFPFCMCTLSGDS